MEAVTFLADESALIAATQYVDTGTGVLFFKFGDVFDWHREGEAGSVQSVFVGLVIKESI